MPRLLVILCLCLTCPALIPQLGAADFGSDWGDQNDRVWIGPEYWANPMEDWRLKEGRVECIRGGANRTLHLLTHQVGNVGESMQLSTVIGLQEGSGGAGTAGFSIGIQSELGDYRSSLLRGRGWGIVVNSAGKLLIVSATGNRVVKSDAPDTEVVARQLQGQGVRLRASIAIEGDDAKLSVRLEHVTTGDVLHSAKSSEVLKASDLAGNIALAHNVAGNDSDLGTNARFWYRDWEVSGDRIEAHPEQTFGPILYAMHTLSRGVMKMTAQMPPVGTDDDQTVVLQVPVEAAKKILRVPEVESTRVGNTDWAPIARANMDSYSRTAHFRIANWNDGDDVPYRLTYQMRERTGAGVEHEYQGTVRRDPTDKSEISVAGFTGHQDTAFPNALLVSNVLKHDPDVLLFTGDQIYEGNGGFGIIRAPKEPAVLNYLRKIYLWGWSFQDVLRDRPSIVLPDDHDVYQGNIWGEFGKPVPGGIRDHAQGGFAQDPDFVNAVFRTQAGHHPDAYDPTPKLQGIDCFYGDMVYGRISFAIIEDRYFKSGPEGKVNTWSGRPDHVKDETYDTSQLDKPGLALLGERQLTFLNDWAAEWTGADMKCVCSQTIFCNLANYHGGNQEFIFADLDSNGWPQTGRNRAVDAMRRGFAFHYAGDQHLPSIVHNGIDTWGDANWSFCVPSTAAGYPRSWRPDQEGRPVQNRPDPNLPNTGEYRDAFGNLITVYGIGNPARKNRRPVLELLHDKASGYGIVRFNKAAQTIRMECWRLIFDAHNPQPEDQFPGWPKTIRMVENYGRQATDVLPPIRVTGLSNPVLQVIEEQTGELVYARRFQPDEDGPLPVFAAGTYTIRVGDPDQGPFQVRRGVTTQPVAAPAADPLRFEFGE